MTANVNYFSLSGKNDRCSLDVVDAQESGWREEESASVEIYTAIDIVQRGRIMRGDSNPLATYTKAMEYR